MAPRDFDLDDAFDDDGEDTLTQVFPDGFSAPCERCGGPSLGDRLCVECEMRMEATL